MGKFICTFVVRIWHTVNRFCHDVANLGEKNAPFGLIVGVLKGWMKFEHERPSYHLLDGIASDLQNLSPLMTRKNNKMVCAPSEDSDQPGHLPRLIRVFAVHMKKAWVLSYPLSTQRRFWSDWADADPSLRWAHSHFVGFVMRWLVCYCPGT